MTMSPNDVALNILRRSTASVSDLERALDSIDLTLAEAEVDVLEAERRQLLAGAGTDQQIDFVEEKIRTANRAVERLAAAREELPGRIEARRAKEKAADARIKKSEVLRWKALEALVQIDELAPRLAELLEVVRAADSQISATNYDLADLGRSDSLDGTVDLLARHLKCQVSDLPPIRDWNIAGYLPRTRDDRLLGAARGLLDSQPRSDKEQP